MVSEQRGAGKPTSLNKDIEELIQWKNNENTLEQ